MPQRPSEPGRHQATTTRRRRLAAAGGIDTVLNMLAAVVIVVVALGVVLARGDRPAAASEPTACRRSDTAAWALISGGVQYKDVHGSIDNRALSDPQLRRLYAAAQHAHLACRDEVARQATTGQDGP